MPRRTTQHISGDQASLAVQTIIADAGFAVEPVKNDYGEDLLVQTSHSGELDASRLWFQVKGTHSIKTLTLKRGGFRYSVPLKHALRWIRSGDPVIVVLWDLAAGVGYFADPAEQLDDVDLMQGLAKTVTISFDQDNVLSKRVVQGLAWESRLDRYHTLILRQEAIASEAQDDTRRASRAQSTIKVLALDLLLSIGVVREEAPDELRASDEVVQSFAHHFAQARTDEADPEVRVGAAAAVAILEQTARATGGVGLTEPVIRASLGVLMAVLRLRDPVRLAALANLPAAPGPAEGG